METSVNVVGRGVRIRGIRAMLLAVSSAAAMAGDPEGMRWIPPGRFQMGAASSDGLRRSDEVRHEVELTHGIWMGTGEVSQAEYEALMGTNPSRFVGADLPVHGVTWDEARRWCARKTLADRQAHLIYAGESYRLPTEAEWEYAARAGGEPTLATELAGRSWIGKSEGPRPSGAGDDSVNAWGLRNMSGNVAEWVQDHYGLYPYGPARNPWVEWESGVRVIRGGAWMEPVAAARETARTGAFEGVRWAGAGFRPVLAHGLSDAVTMGRPAELWRGMLACYALDGDAMDASGLGRHAALKGGAIAGTDRFGKQGRAIWMSGPGGSNEAEDCVGVPILFDEGTTSWSWVGWVRSEGTSGRATLMAFADHTTLWIEPGKVGMQWGDGDVSATVPTSVPVGVWVQIAVTVTGERLGVLVDGVLVGTAVRPSGYPAMPVVAGCLGGQGFGNSASTLKGGLDDVRIFARGLEDKDVVQLHALEVVPLNHPPVVTGDSMTRPQGTRVAKVRLAELLANDLDVDGDPLQVMSVANPTPSGASVSLVGNFAVYAVEDGNAGHGTFEYQVSDGLGGHAAWGAVTVFETVRGAGGLAVARPNAVRVVVDGDNRVFVGIGVPGRRYRVQYTTNESEPYTWRDFDPVAEVEASAAGTLGLFQYVDRGPSDGLRLYRAIGSP